MLCIGKESVSLLVSNNISRWQSTFPNSLAVSILHKNNHVHHFCIPVNEPQQTIQQNPSYPTILGVKVNDTLCKCLFAGVTGEARRDVFGKHRKTDPERLRGNDAFFLTSKAPTPPTPPALRNTRSVIAMGNYFSYFLPCRTCDKNIDGSYLSSFERRIE